MLRSILAALLAIPLSLFAATTSDSGSPLLTLTPSGTGAGATGEVHFKELVANGYTHVGLKSPDSVASNCVWTLPAADGSANQALSTNGSKILQWVTPFTIKYLAKSSSYTAVAADNGSAISMTTGAGNQTVTLTAAATVGAGWMIWVQKADGGSGDVLVARSGADLIDGQTGLSINAQYQSVCIVCTGSGFITVSESQAYGASGQLLIGQNASGSMSIWTSLGGDATLSSGGVLTIGNLAITNAKIANSTIDLTAKVTGVLPIANGGTNSSTSLNGGRPIISNASAIVESSGYQTITGDYSVLVGDCMSVIDVNFSASHTITLPAAATAGKGFKVTIRRVDANAAVSDQTASVFCKITTTSNDGISGVNATTNPFYLSAQYSFIVLRSTGTNGNSSTTGWLVDACSDWLEATATNTSAATSGNLQDLTSFKLGPGEWDLSASMHIGVAGTTDTSDFIGVSTTSGNSNTGLAFGDNELGIFHGSGAVAGGSIVAWRQSVTSATIYYLKAASNYTGTAPLQSGRLSARRAH